MRFPRASGGECANDLPDGTPTPASVPCAIDFVIDTQENRGNFTTTGFDVSGTLRFADGPWGRFAFQGEGTYVLRYRYQRSAGGAYFDNAGRSSIENDFTTIPRWVEVGAYSAISLGTLFGGWRIVHTMGSRITKLRPIGGFAAETGGAIAIQMATHYGIPVSTTHTITGAIVGVGATNRLSAVRWGIAGRIVWAWVSTIPAAGLMAALAYLILSHIVVL